MSKPLLSIGMIFKNDIRTLERCMESLTPLRKAVSCELVMADTGSTDGSRAIAERYADILIDFPWINDFAAARNAVLDRCTGVWCLTIDSDEWLDPDFKDLVKFLKGKERDQYDIGTLVQRNYQDKQLKDYGDFFAMRMGRRRNGELFYQGAIHEELEFRDGKCGAVMILPTLILHHDGYIEMTPGQLKAKLHRNMVLLRTELEKRPEDLRTLGQCVDSAEDSQERREYADRMLEVVHRSNGPGMVFESLAYQKCTQVYYDSNENDLALECYQEWKERCPESAFCRVDGEALAAALYYRKKEYAEALAHINSYQDGIKEIQKHQDIRRLDRLYGQYNMDNLRWHSNLKMIRFYCLCALKRYEEADKFLREVDQVELTIPDRGVIIIKVLREAEHFPSAPRFLSDCWKYDRDDRYWEDQGTDQQKATQDFILMLQEHMDKNGQAGIELVARMEGLPGLCARLLLTEDPEARNKLWEQIGDWEWVRPQVYLNTMDLRQPLPTAFYRQPSERLMALITTLAVRPSFSRTVLDWLTHSAPPETPGELTWQLNLVTAALQTWDWSIEIPQGQTLCALYADLSPTYLDNIYNPDLLNEEDIMILPGMQRFAWYYRQALAAWEGGDELGYVRSLRAGLEAAPGMKGMVNFLLEHKPKTAAQRQLEELAGQVQAILNRYAPDDPAVIALKQSEAYQKVAPLLEQQGPSGTQLQTAEEPLSPAPLEEALTGSREEIADSIRQNLGRWGAPHAKARTNYWETYPLWGKDEHEVVDNLSTALSSHGADFRWLFDRLGDEQSRRVLTAVVRAWRFFEIKPLGQVIDLTYDDYFDLSLLRCDDREVVADLGAYVGDTFLSYVKNYGSMAYRRYYCYEITKDSFDALTRATAPYPRVVLRRKGAGDGPGTMTLDAGADASSNTLSEGKGDSAETVEIVALDDDITEPLTLIKMDIEGAEQSALRGCARHIREDRPKLALSVYHNFEDLWKLPRMVEELAPGYRFYLRYHGRELWPSEITLLGIPD